MPVVLEVRIHVNFYISPGALELPPLTVWDFDYSKVNPVVTKRITCHDFYDVHTCCVQTCDHFLLGSLSQGSCCFVLDFW